MDRERLSYVEIRDRRDRELVTVIELLSPSNKYMGPDREQYLAKRMELLNGPAHLVEIDLLRGGPPLPAAGRPDCSYSVLVSRVESRPDAEFWPIALRERLPVIPVPVRAPDSDAQLDLQAVLDRIYDDAGYADYIYEGNPRPRLDGDDAVWARQFLPQTIVKGTKVPALLAIPGSSERIPRHDLAPGAGGDRPPGHGVHRVLDEGGVAVAEEQVHAAGVVAPRGLPAGVVVDDAIGPVGVGREVVVI